MSIRCIAHLVVSFCSALYATGCIAAETNVVRWLTTTPVPVMAWGLDRLERKITNQIQVGGFVAPNASVFYRASDKTIVAEYVGFTKPERLHERSDCHAALESGKGYIGFTDRRIEAAADDPAHPKVNPIWHKGLQQSYDSLAQLFAGYGYDMPDQPNELGKELARMIVVVVELNDWEHREKLRCSSRLLEHEVAFDRQQLVE